MALQAHDFVVIVGVYIYICICIYVGILEHIYRREYLHICMCVWGPNDAFSQVRLAVNLEVRD